MKCIFNSGRSEDALFSADLGLDQIEGHPLSAKKISGVERLPPQITHRKSLLFPMISTSPNTQEMSFSQPQDR